MARNLHSAKKQKNDGFYTQYEDIQKELNNYKNSFKGQTVFCNCDDPYESQFFQYFIRNFNYLGLKKLICTSYSGSPIIGNQLSLFDDNEEPLISSNGYVIEVTSVLMKNRRGVTDEDVENLLTSESRGVKKLAGDGDFRSKECIKYLKEADIVVTNPPFSLYREYIAQLIKYKKKFLIIGNLNAMKYGEIFPYYQSNQIWFGATYFKGGAAYFVGSPELYDPKKMLNPKNAYIKDGKLYWRVNGVRWYTNLDHNKRHEELVLYATYNPKDYPNYDNYDAIEVSKVVKIPKGYKGVMGVPISFMDKYNPEQFEIIGLSMKAGFGLQSNKFYDDFKEIKQDGTFTGSSGKKTNGNPMIEGKHKKRNYYIDEFGNCAYSLYDRLFIVNKKIIER